MQTEKNYIPTHLNMEPIPLKSLFFLAFLSMEEEAREDWRLLPRPKAESMSSSATAIYVSYEKSTTEGLYSVTVIQSKLKILGFTKARMMVNRVSEKT